MLLLICFHLIIFEVFVYKDSEDRIVATTLKPYAQVGEFACLKLKAHTGVCWAGIDRNSPVLVKNVHDFPGHIACSTKSQSEIVVPVYNASNQIIGVLDVDSETKNSFNEIDEQWLIKICKLIYAE